MLQDPKKILVGLSGGVDSAVTAWLLQKEGFVVEGLFLKMLGSKQIAVSQENVEKISRQLGIPLALKDISREFQRQIINYFIKEYQRNHTPNPCVICNAAIKFHWLLKEADRRKIKWVATGHYALVKEQRIAGAKAKKEFLLLKGRDKRKDQSYFLQGLSQQVLSRVKLPLGKYTKEEVRKIACKEKLFLGQRESQNICFLPAGQELGSFLKKGGIKAGRQGKIVDNQGKVLGRHDGLVFYTKGQRKGIKLGNGPYYVIEKKIQNNQLVVSRQRRHPFLVNTEIEIKDSNWIGAAPVLKQMLEFKSRYQAVPSKGHFIKRAGNRWIAKLKTPQWAVAEGQFLAVYRGKQLLGGGVISKVIN